MNIEDIIEQSNAIEAQEQGYFNSLKESFLHNYIYTYYARGKDGKQVKFMKIRTMIHGADKLREQVIRENGVNEYGNPKNDWRTISSRAWMRISHVDELPQLINYLQGKLNWIGWRPQIPLNVKKMPKELIQLMDNYEPGLIPVNQKLPTNSTIENVYDCWRKYIVEKEKHPYWAPISNFFQVFYNKTVKGRLSS